MDENKKRCAYCGRLRPREAFNRRTSAKDGLQSYCKSCQAKDKQRRKGMTPEEAGETTRKGLAMIQTMLEEHEPTQGAIPSLFTEDLAGVSTDDILGELKARGYVGVVVNEKINKSYYLQ